MSLIRTILFRWFTPADSGPAGGGEEITPDEATQPFENGSSFQMAEKTIYQKLVAVARGDAHQVLPAMDAISRGHDVDETLLFDRIKEVGRSRPYEAGHLMARLFERATTKTRLAIIREFVLSPVMGDKHAVGDLFVTMTEHSTREELRREIYPPLYRLIENTKDGPQPVQSKRAFLIALLKGSMSER